MHARLARHFILRMALVDIGPLQGSSQCCRLSSCDKTMAARCVLMS